MTEWSYGVPPIPRETGRRARAVFGENNFYLRLGDRLPAILREIEPGLRLALPPHDTAPAPLHAFVTFFQMVEELSDRQASDALRTRVDWHYALHLPPNNATLREEDLCAFRQVLYGDEALSQAFTGMVKRLAALGGTGAFYTEAWDLERTLMTLCRINRVRWILQAICDLLGVLASRRAEWLEQIARPHWYASYWSSHAHLPGLAAGASGKEITALGKQLGDDARYLLASLAELGELEAVELSEMRRLALVWGQQFEAGVQDGSRLTPFCSFCIRGRKTRAEEGA